MEGGEDHRCAWIYFAFSCSNIDYRISCSIRGQDMPMSLAAPANNNGLLFREVIGRILVLDSSTSNTGGLCVAQGPEGISLKCDIGRSMFLRGSNPRLPSARVVHEVQKQSSMRHRGRERFAMDWCFHPNLLDIRWCSSRCLENERRSGCQGPPTYLGFRLSR